MVLAQSVKMHGEAEVGGRLELLESALQLERVGAEIDETLLRDQALDDLNDIGVQEGLAAGDAHDGRIALVHGVEALFHRQLLLENVGRILHLSASGAGQIAAEGGLKHQHQGIVSWCPLILCLMM